MKKSFSFRRVFLNKPFPVRRLSIVLLFLCGATLFAGLSKSVLSTPTPSLEGILSLPEEKLDFGIAALTINKVHFPTLDIAAKSRILDALAEDAQREARGSQEPLVQIKAMNTAVFDRGGYSYDVEAPSLERKEANCLAYLLETKRGNCVSMAELYVAVAQRAGYPIYMVDLPGHVMARYVDPRSGWYNIETTARGAVFSAEEYFKRFALGPETRRQGSYFKTLSYRESLGGSLCNSAVLYFNNGEFERAHQLFGYGIALNPLAPHAFQGMGENYDALSVLAAGEKAVGFERSSAHLNEMAQILGYIDPDSTPMGRRANGG